MNRGHIVALGLLLLPSCVGTPSQSNETTSTTDDQNSSSVTMNAVLVSWGEHLIMEGYQTFHRQMVELTSLSGAFCESPTKAGLKATRAQWKSARVSWKRQEVFAFGPYEAYPERLGSNVDFWPARENNINKHLGNESAVTLETLDAVGTSERGLPVIEYLLFAGDLDSFQFDPRRCEYLLAATEDTSNFAKAFVDAWDPEQNGFLLELTSAGERGIEYMDDRAAMSEIVNRVAHILENIRKDKLPANAGDVESRFSGHATEDIRANLATLGDLFFGTDADTSLGLADSALLRQNPQHGKAFREHLIQLNTLLDALDSDLGPALSEQPKIIANIEEKTRQLQTLITVDIIQLLGLVQSFNDNDGD